MRNSHFHAQVISTGPLEGVDEHVGWGADAAGSAPHLILMRTGSELSIVCGTGTTYATCHGGLLSAKVAPSMTTITLTEQAASMLGVDPLLVVTHDEALADVDHLQEQLDQMVGLGTA